MRIYCSFIQIMLICRHIGLFTNNIWIISSTSEVVAIKDFLYIEINVIALVIILLIYGNMRRKINIKLPEHKLFLTLMLLTAQILFFDAFVWTLDGDTSALANMILLISSTGYFLLQPIICSIWSFYVDYQINHSLERIKKLMLPLSIPVIINTLFTILSIFGNYYYYYDYNNVYHRGPYFFILPILSFVYVAYTIVYVSLNRKRIQGPFFLTFLTFTVPPVAGAAIQLAFYGVSIIWVGMTLSLLIIFMNIQNEQMYMDYLTGLFNRRQLDYYLQDLISKNKLCIAGIMLDLNSFKHINDHYGHYAGDEALKHASQLLQKTFRNKAFLSRFGGDEFVILLEVKSRSELDKTIIDLKRNVQQFNKTKALPYKIDFSIGADLYPRDAKISGQDFLNYIDTLMYKDKHTLLQKKFSAE